MSEEINLGIYNLNNAICRHIENISRDSRGEVAQDVITDLRTFTEHIMLKIYSNFKGVPLALEYDNICSAQKYIYSNGKYKWLGNFHKMLQSVVSHYKPSEEASERLMLKYYEYLFRIRELMQKHYKMNLLDNLEKFPLDIDLELIEYYQKIGEELEKYSIGSIHNKDRYYIHKTKPIILNNSLYYEVTLSHANDYSSKTDRIIAFTKIPIDLYYASKMNFINTNIEIKGKKIPILIINAWEIAIRNCEFKNFIKLVKGIESGSNYMEMSGICKYMTISNLNLLDIVNLEDSEYEFIREICTDKSRVTIFFDSLDICRTIIKNKKKGMNILKYLLFTMNNTIIKNQLSNTKNQLLSDLYIKNGAIPFDNMPFTFSLIKHNPMFKNLFFCFDMREYEVEQVASIVKKNTEKEGKIFTSIKSIDLNKEYIEQSINIYNKKLWSGHRPYNELKIDKGQIFMKKYVLDSRFILDKLKELSKKGIDNYSVSIETWLNNEYLKIDCDEKIDVIKSMFKNSSVSVLNGAAGTGKTTLINHISHYFSDKSKLFIAQTNPAVDNLKRKILVSNSEFMTITKFLSRNNYKVGYDVLIIDECSAVSNYDMKRILEKASFEALILVGDEYQIESIVFGNWFNIVKEFLPKTSQIELKKTYRTKDKKLLELWEKVRKMDDNILECLTKEKYSNILDDSIYDRHYEDEIILCLNYDGLYGINNINRILQENNKSTKVLWGIQVFKEGDPILFNDSKRFGSLIYNNMKGKILRVSLGSDQYFGDKIEFDVELDININLNDVNEEEFELLYDNEYNGIKKSVIRFSVYKNNNSDEDDFDLKTVVPFQIAYAVSIHKAQGLEYNSVKVIITEENNDEITHNLFYTAITRAKKYLKVYWTPEVENRVLSVIEPKNFTKDINLIYKVDV